VIDSPQTDQPVRPELLKILCILTFIGSGVSSLANIIMYLSFEDWKLAFENGLLDGMGFFLQEEALLLLLNMNPNFFLIQFFFYLMSLAGAIAMWKLRKIGFHIYTFAQVLLLIDYNIFLSSQPFPFVPFLISLTFIVLYSKNLSSMH
jgi:hypothetical protein